MDVKVNWSKRLSFNGTADSGYTMPLGGKIAAGGDEDGFQPMELMALSLAGCTAMDVISILSKKRENVTGFEVQVHADRAQEHPKVFTQAKVVYLVTGHSVNEAAVIRAIELSATKYCPAQAMLNKVIPITLEYQIFEDNGDGERTLVVSGSYQVLEKENSD